MKRRGRFYYPAAGTDPTSSDDVGSDFAVRVPSPIGPTHLHLRPGHHGRDDDKKHKKNETLDQREGLDPEEVDDVGCRFFSTAPASVWG